MEQEKITYGQYLKKTREDKQISIEQVARESKISLDVLHAIEEEDSERLPDDVFIRGFIRTYSEITGADPDVALKLYNPAYMKPVKTESAEETHTLPVTDTKNGMKLIVITGVLIVIIICSYFGIRFLAHDQELENKPLKEIQKEVPVDPSAQNIHNDSQQTQGDVKPSGIKSIADDNEKPAEGDTIEQPDDVLTENPVEETTPDIPDELNNKKEVADVSYKLNITCLEKTWMKIIADGEKPVEHILKPGDVLDLEANTGYNLLIGNAIGVKLKLNDTIVPVPGKSGQVVNINLP